MKIGIYQGTFDPIHSGHVDFANRAISEAGLEKVIIVAEKEPYRKKPHASWDHRQAMIERATEDVPNVDHDYEFAARLAHQHTMIDILSAVKAHYGPEHETWFLVGSDTFEHMHKWRDVAKTHVYGGFVVALRSDHTEAWLQQKMQALEKIGMKLHYKIIKNMYATTSSSIIRTQIHEGRETPELKPTVRNYSIEHDLY